MSSDMPSARHNVSDEQKAEQQWRELQRRHQTSPQHKQQAELYQHRVKHQMQLLQQHHQQPKLKQSYFEQRKIKLYSLRGRGVSPLRSCTGVQAKSSTPVSDRANSTIHLQSRQGPQPEATRCMTPASPTGCIAARGENYSEATRSNLIPKQTGQPPDCRAAGRHAVGAGGVCGVPSGDGATTNTALSTKLRALKNSNQRLRASMHSTGATGRVPVGNPGTAAPAPVVQKAASSHAGAAATAASNHCGNVTIELGVERVYNNSQKGTAVFSACHVEEGVQSEDVHDVAAAVKAAASGLTSGGEVYATVGGGLHCSVHDPIEYSRCLRDAGKDSVDIGKGIRSTSSPPSCNGLVADLLQQALQVEADGKQQVSQVKYLQHRQHQPECGESFSEDAGCNAHSSSMPCNAAGKSASISISSSDDAADTGSSISFCVQASIQETRHPVTKQLQQQQHKDEQPLEAQILDELQAKSDQVMPDKPQQQRRQASQNSPQWNRGGRIRTALFKTPKVHTSEQRSRQDSSRGDDGSVGSVEATIAEAEHQLQLLLNSYTWHDSRSPTAQWNTTTSNLCSSSSLPDQQQYSVQYRSESFLSPECSPSSHPKVSSPDLGLTDDSIVSITHPNRGTAANDADEVSWQAAEEGFLRLLDASLQQCAQQQTCQQSQQRRHSPCAPQQQPWRPPGVAPAPASSKSNNALSPSHHASLRKRAASNALQHQQQQLVLDASNSALSADDDELGVSDSHCSQWRLSIPDSIDEPQQEARSGISPVDASLQNKAAPLSASSVTQSHRVDRQSQMQRATTVHWGHKQGQHYEEGTNHNSNSWEQQASQQCLTALDCLPDTCEQSCNKGVLQQGRAVHVSTPDQLLQDELDQQLVSRVFEEWSYQTVSSRWQHLLACMGQCSSDDLEQAELGVCQPGTRQWPRHMQYEVQQQAAAVDSMMSDFFQHWQQHVQQQTAATSIAEQQWSAYYQWRLAARIFRVWRNQALDGVLIAEMLEEQANDFARLWSLRRCCSAWRHRFLPEARARALLKEVNNAAAESFAAQRTKRLLGHCVAGWTAAVVVGKSARCAAQQQLQKVWLQSVLHDWRATTRTSRDLKREILAAWHQELLQRQVYRAYCVAADEFAAQVLLRKACRSWVVAWCRFASARVFAKQLQARCQSAILAALASNARHQQQKRHLEQRATDLRRRKLLTLCLRFWRVWVGYQRLLNRTAAAVESGIRRRMLQQVMNQWRGLVQYKAWQKEACETAEGFYWCRLSTRLFSSWRHVAHQQAQLHHLYSTAAACHDSRLLSNTWSGWKHEATLTHRCSEAVKLRQQRLLRTAFDCWWSETVGAARVFEFQVSALVRLVTACFLSWRFYARQSKQLQLGLTTWQQGQHDRLQHKQQLVFDSWRQHILLMRQWRSHAPLLAAAYYQESLIRQAWEAWKQQLSQQKRLLTQQNQPQRIAEHQQVSDKQQHMQVQAGSTGQETRLLEEPLVAQLQTQLSAEPSTLKLSLVTLSEATQTSGGVDAGPLANKDRHAAAPVAAALGSAAEPVGELASTSQLSVSLGGQAAIWQVQQDPRGLIGQPESSSSGELAAAGTDSVQDGSQEASVEAWRGWQQQQQEQQLELIQLSIAAHHHAARLLHKCFSHWARMASAAAAVMSAQALLKHDCQIELLQYHRHLQSALQQQQERYVNRPFRMWLQQASLDRSAAVGFRCYNQLLKGFVSWRAVVLQQRQQSHDVQFQLKFQADESVALLSSAPVGAAATPHVALTPCSKLEAAATVQSAVEGHNCSYQATARVDDINHMIHVDQLSDPDRYEAAQPSSTQSGSNWCDGLLYNQPSPPQQQQHVEDKSTSQQMPIPMVPN